MSDNNNNFVSRRSFAEEGLRAIRELERVLFFTDLTDGANTNDDLHSTAAVSDALDDLDRVLSMSSHDKVGNHSIIHCYTSDAPSVSSRSSKNRSVYKFEDDDEESKICETSSTTGAAELMAPDEASALRNLMALLQTHLNATLESGRKTVKEAERVVFFTDLSDNIVEPHDHRDDLGFSLVAASGSAALVQLQELLKQLELALMQQLEQMGHQSHKAYKEAERRLLFTDVPDYPSDEDDAPKQRRRRSSSKPKFNPQQGVLLELERQLLFSDAFVE